jgi:DnaK suppressor protein
VSQIYSYEFRALLEGQREQMLECLRSNSPASCKNRGIVAAQMSLEGQQLREIEAALARIGDGLYGACINCGGEISRARLKSDPTVKHCTGCQVSAPTESSTRE